ncbi:hypothetical protein AWH48_20190 [Domibacillus aminovorans]|uniref:Uncharacterized protein n=1 Tax=Domibacillus aminovorans TaxID=29332 RepID=A0A177KQ96_9BACI|nr:DUF5677 domain-containing protein [Domibacillus aminovorans]OAH55186.1 hypothetical protein AWH48_20190 [Domibacillus aminovorans]
MSKESDQYLINYCDELVVKIYVGLTESKNEPDIPAVIPLLLFQTILDKIRAIQLLYESGESRVGDSSYGIVRAVFECQWSLLYILKEDTEFRSLSYYYFSRLEEAKKNLGHLNYLLSLRESSLNKRQDNLGSIELDQKRYRKAEERGDSARLEQLSKKYEADGLSPVEVMDLKMKRVQAMISELTTTIEAMKRDKVLAEMQIQVIEREPQFAHLRHELSLVPKKKVRRPSWFSLKSHIGTIYALAEHLGLEDQYEGPYGTFSQETHGLNATKQIALKGDKAILRNKEESTKNIEAKEAFHAGIYILLSIVLKFLNYYGKQDEVKELRRTMSSMQ